MKRKSRKGNALLESALVYGVGLFMLVGTFDFAQFLFVHQSLVERVRNAARYGVVNPYDPSAITNMVVYGQTTAPPVAPGMPPPPGAFGLTAAMVNVQRLDQGTNDDRLSVSIQNFQFTFYSPLISKMTPITAIGAVFPYEDP